MGSNNNNTAAPTPALTLLVLADDTLTISSAKEDKSTYIAVLENDTFEEGGELIVKSITSQATYGECIISFDLKQVVYTAPEDGEEFIADGTDECTYEACVEDESSFETMECATATLTITIVEDTTSTADQLDTTNTGSTLSMESISQSSVQLVSSSSNANITKDAVVAIHENTAAVGSFENEGIVVVFTRETDRGEWTEQGTLSTPDGAQFSSFGGSIDIYENTIIVGAWGDSDEDAGVFSKGAAHIFVRNDNGTWTHQAKLVDENGGGGDYLGYAVAVFEDTAVVGAITDDDNAENSGSVHVFVRDGEMWTLEQKLVHPEGGVDDEFGNSVDIYENTIVVGAWLDDDEEKDSKNSGSAHLFVRNDGTWTHQVKLTDEFGVDGDQFGNIVSIWKDTIVIGAKKDDHDLGVDSGSAHVYVRTDDSWTPQYKLVSPDGFNEDQFGNSVSIYEDTIVVGARWDDDIGENSGSAHVFSRDGDEWIHETKLLASDGNELDFFGYSTGIWNGTVVIGSKVGTAHVFVKDGDDWQ